MNVTGQEPVRTGATRPGRWPVLGWHLMAGWCLFSVPYWLLLVGGLWPVGSVSRPEGVRGLWGLLGLSACYVLSGVAMVVVWPRLGRRSLRALVSIGVLTLVLFPFLLALLLVPDVWYSSALLLVGLVGAVVLIVVPALVPPRLLTVAGAVLAVAAVGSGLALATVPPPALTTVESGALLTSHGTIRAVEYDGLVQPRSRGGGIQALGSAFILATGDGELFRLRFPVETDSPTVERLPLRVPLARREFAAAVGDSVPAELFRVPDVLVREVGDSLQFVATHHHWDTAARCFTLRVSRAAVHRNDLARPGSAGLWTTIYETRPCLPLKRHVRGWLFAGPHSGGRLADLGDGRLVLTVGDMQFDGWNSEEALPQDTAADYGKTLIVSLAGGAEHLTIGHRNPQGLHIDAEGDIWTTEHGPQGGDVLHRLVAGANYGWPHVTYGTEYGDVVWPLQGQGQWDRSRFRPAVFAWVPSVGLSNLISVRRGPVPEWRGDLLIATLEGRRLLRVRFEGERVVYVEPIPIGKRIRDLAEGPDGRIVLVLDDGSIMVLAPMVTPTGSALFAQCAGCHGTGGTAASAIAPDLRGVYGRRIAADPSFSYSPALRSLAGRWDAERLHAFLADPQAFAPGTTMTIEPVADSAARAALIEHLKTIR